MGQASTAVTTTRALRAQLRETLERAARGKEIIVTLRGKPYVRIVPIASAADVASRYPLRGSVRFIADDFDAPMPEMWDALQKKAPRAAKRRKK